MQKNTRKLIIAASQIAGTLVLGLGLSSTPASFAAPAPAQPDQTAFEEAAPQYRTEEIPVIRTSASLYSMLPEGGAEQVKLTGVYPERTFTFYAQKNEIISKAQLTLKYTPSPSLIPAQSQVNVYLNGQVQATLPIAEDELGKQVLKTIDFNTKLIEDTNRVTVEFVGAYMPVCGNVASPALWLAIDDSSYMSFSRQKLRLSNELAGLPTPFINVLGPASTTLPIFFTDNPSNEVRTAAGIFASWVGTKTEWRGANFPVYIDEMPAERDFVAFITNQNRPEFMKYEPEFVGPTIAMLDSPNSLASKILIIGGTNEHDLLTAASWLASTSQSMIRSSYLIKDYKPLPKRQAYDAPNWISTNGKVELAQMTKYHGQLRTTGLRPIPINLELRLPPDLYMAGRSSVNLDLRYRYTKPANGVAGQLRFLLNDQLVDTFMLDPKRTSNSITSQFSLINGLANLWYNTSIPSGLLSPYNVMRFEFRYGMAVAGGSVENCKSEVMVPHQAEIDPSSTIDFSGFYHFAKLPNIRLFTVSGFPFTRYADLSETGVLLPRYASTATLTMFLNTLARMSSQTGYPATKVVVSDKIDKELFKDKDILVFSTTGSDIDALETLDADSSLEKLKTRIQNEFAGSAAPAANEKDISEGMAAIVQFQSPFDDDRSMVALFGDGQDGSYELNKQLMNPGSLGQVSGSVAVIRPNSSGPASYEVGPVYYTGSLPWHQRVWYSLLDQPLLLVLFTLICALVLAGAIYYLMHSLIRLRGRRRGK